MTLRPKLATFGLLILLACSRDMVSESTHAAKVADGAAARVMPPNVAADMAVSIAPQQARQGGSPPPLPLPSPQEGNPAPSMIIRNGSASVEVDSLETAIAALRALAARVGGYVANTQMQTGERQIRSASIEVRIPAARFDDALNGLQPLGKVEWVNTTAQDVGEEYVDTEARMQNARRLEDRLITLLATRTGKLEDVLSVERELARVREEIERYEGRLRYLRAHVAMSTLTVTAHEQAPIVGTDPGTNVLAEAAKSAWRNFVYFLAGFIASLGWLVPLAALAIAVALGARRALRMRQRPSAAPALPA